MRKRAAALALWLYKASGSYPGNKSYRGLPRPQMSETHGPLSKVKGLLYFMITVHLALASGEPQEKHPTYPAHVGEQDGWALVHPEEEEDYRRFSGIRRHHFHLREDNLLRLSSKSFVKSRDLFGLWLQEPGSLRM